MEPGDSELVERCRTGDRAAFGLLYAAHAGRVRAYLQRSGFAAADVDDLVQETFTRVLRSLHTFDPARGEFRPWLATVAHNVARRHWRRGAQDDNFDPELAGEVLAARDNPAPASETREEVRALVECIEALLPDLARLVRLRYVEARTTRGIAAALDLAEATVRLRLGKAMYLLQRCLRSKGVWE